MNGYDSDTEKVKLLREKCNHDLLKSEEEYVNTLEAIVKYVFKPLHQNSEKLRVKPQHVQYVFMFLEHMFQFHLNFFSVIRDHLDVVPDFYKYSNFVQMYDDYLSRFDTVLKVFAEWKSLEFRCFVTLRLENEKVKKNMEAPMLYMLPWYLYNPFERLKVYYKFLRDISTLSKEGDDDKKLLDDCLNKFKKVYHNIKRNEKRLQIKTKLLEVQLQIFGNFKTIVKDDRCFLMSKPCQIKRKVFHKKYKRIVIYLFNDLLVWVSARGEYKGSYSLFSRDLHIEKTGKAGDGEFSIGLSSEKTKKAIVCANDEQRDIIMGKVIEVYQKCQELAHSATTEEKAEYEEIALTETQMDAEVSQSSANTFDAREASTSISVSDMERVAHKQSTPQLEQILEKPQDTKKNGQESNESTNNQNLTGKIIISPLSSPRAKKQENSTDAKKTKEAKEQSTSIRVVSSNKQTKKEKNKRQQSQSTREGIKPRRQKGEQKYRNNLQEIEKMKITQINEKDNIDIESQTNINTITIAIPSNITENVNNINNIEKKNDDDKEKGTSELHQTIQELQDLLHKKDDHIKTLELSNESIRNTLLMTQNQYSKLQQDYEALTKRLPARSQSIGKFNTKPYSSAGLLDTSERNKIPEKPVSSEPPRRILQRAQTQNYFSLFKQ